MPATRPPTVLVPPRRPRGRPKTEDLEALEASLVTVGRQLFIRHGYGATTMSDVAEAARCSKTTLYSRFPSKAALFRAIVAEQIESWDTGLHHTPMPDCDTLEEVLLTYGDVVLRAAATPDFMQIARLLHSEAGRFPELAEISKARFRKGVDYLGGLIGRFAELEATPCRDPEAAAELFIMTIQGWASVMMVGDRTVSREARTAWLENMVRSFVGGRSVW